MRCRKTPIPPVGTSPPPGAAWDGRPRRVGAFRGAPAERFRGGVVRGSAHPLYFWPWWSTSRLTRSPPACLPPLLSRSVQFAQVFKHDGAGGRACAAARPAGLFARQSDGTDVSAAEDNKPPPRSPSAGVPPASSPRPVAKVAPAKSPRGVPPPPQPTVKRPRRDASAAAAGPASPAAPRKASTPVTPAPSNSGSEDSFGAGAATATAAARPVPPPVRVPSVPEDDEALARRLHAELNCTPARSSRNRGGGQQQAAVGRDRIHGDDPGLLPSC